MQLVEADVAGEAHVGTGVEELDAPLQRIGARDGRVELAGAVVADPDALAAGLDGAERIIGA